MTEQQSDPTPTFPELEDDYEIIRELGRGGTAVVYLARERSLGRDVAIKLIRPSHVRDEDAVARLIREAQTVGKLQHPNIVMLLGTRRLDDGGLALILQYVAGRTVKERIREEGPLPFADAEEILRDVGRALAYAHRQRIVHRDIKPENVYLDDSYGLARLADFGIARAWDSDSGLTLPGTAIGTPAYMSPEQVDGKELDGRSDVYSLGLLGYEMLTGRQPWAGESLYTVIYKQKNEELPPVTASRADLPDNLRVAIEGALRKRRERRWSSAEAFLEALSRGSTLPPVDDDALPDVWLPEESEDGGDEGAAAEGVPWSEELEDQRTMRYAAASTPGRGEEPSEVPPPSVDRRSGWGVAVLTLMVLLLAGLGLEALVSGPDGYARTLWGYLSSPEDEAQVGGELAGRDLDPTPPQLPESAEPDPAAPFGMDELRDDVSPGEGVAGDPLEELDLQETAVEEDAVPAADVPGSGEVEAPESPDPAAPSVAAAEVVRGSRQEGSVDGVLPQPLELRVLDAAGAPLAGALVRFDVVQGEGRVEPRTSLSDEQGIARAFWTLGGTPGEHAVMARVDGQNGAAVRFEARATLPPLPIRSGVAVGGTHSCMLRSDGRMVCWGANDAGQLGVGGGPGSLRPAGTLDHGPFSDVASGMSHVCGLDREGRAFCWGANDQGQLGTPGAGGRNEPEAVSGAFRFTELAAGTGHTCGITRGGEVACWGGNESGQLGEGTRTRRDGPVRVQSDRAFRQVAAGWRHTCALDVDGAAYCWGANASGELGTGGGPSASPQPVAGGNRFRSLTAGASHTCGLRDDGRLLCWGSNQHGQLGDGTTEPRSRPTAVVADERYRQVTAGGVHTCAITSDQRAYCWGRNPYGQLGDGTRTDRPAPTPVAGDVGFASVHAFGSHTCGRTPGGTVLCWGYNVDGQLGDGSRENRQEPTPVIGLGW